MHVMKQPKQGLELQISNGVKMERRVEEGRRTGERRKESVALW
jgi:hypothetical protein